MSPIRGRHIRVGVISDTHGLLRQAAVDALKGSDVIIHAGDIDTPDVLHALKQTAPVIAVRGNMDYGPFADALAETEFVAVGALGIYVLHDASRLDLDPAAADVRVVIHGHSHRPVVRERAGVLYVNPGSAGPRRFRLPVTVARLQVRSNRVDASILNLEH
jgi:putative phosphoesterase